MTWCVTYSRTDTKGNITIHAARCKGARPLCGVDFGVDGYWREEDRVQCRRCLALRAKHFTAVESPAEAAPVPAGAAETP